MLYPLNYLLFSIRTKTEHFGKPLGIARGYRATTSYLKEPFAPLVDPV